MSRTAIYNSLLNSITEISQMEEPVRPNQRDYDQVSLGGLIYDADLKNYFRDLDKYNAHIASLRKLPCSPDCVGRFIHDCDYEAGKDYEIKTAGDWKWCTQLKGNVFAAPIVPVKSEDGWLTEKPKFTEDCVLVTASKFKDHWEYHIYCIEKQFTDEGWYWGWLTGDGEEYGDIEDLTADKYLIIPKPE